MDFVINSIVIMLLVAAVLFVFSEDRSGKTVEKTRKSLKQWAKVLAVSSVILFGAAAGNSLPAGQSMLNHIALCTFFLLVGRFISIGKPKRFRFPILHSSEYVYVKHVEPDGSFIAEYEEEIVYFRTRQKDLVPGSYTIELPHLWGSRGAPSLYLRSKTKPEK